MLTSLRICGQFSRDRRFLEQELGEVGKIGRQGRQGRQGGQGRVKKNLLLDTCY